MQGVLPSSQQEDCRTRDRERQRKNVEVLASEADVDSG